MDRLETEILIIGGGATGAAAFRDCALRGLKAVLVERIDLASGTTGRNHGLLHSGARYAVNDQESAVECLAENQVLKNIARHCIENTGGLFVTIPGDDLSYHDRLLAACRQVGLAAKEISRKEALRIEPDLNPEVVKAIQVPDATIDPFRLTAANVLDAVEHSGIALTHTEVVTLIRHQDRLVGARCQDKLNGATFDIYAHVLINASGIWSQKICAMVGVDLKVFPSKGSMLIIDYRINRVVVNRCRPPTDGDIIVPGDTVSLIGTTSKKIPYDQIDNLYVDDDEIQVLLDDGEKLIPNLSRTRVLRAYAGVRPLISTGETDQGRQISRGIVLIDHAIQDGLQGLITIVGGKLMTCRLMAEKAVNLASRKLGRNSTCSTATLPLPGSEKKTPTKRTVKQFSGIPESVVGSTLYRHGERVYRILGREPENYGLVCECEMVTRGEVKYAVENLNVKDLMDLRRRTRIGMGPCQGETCAYRAAGLLEEFGTTPADEASRQLMEFLEERWKGIRPIFWGDAMREIEFTFWIYQGLFGLADLGSMIPDDKCTTIA